MLPTIASFIVLKIVLHQVKKKKIIRKLLNVVLKYPYPTIIKEFYNILAKENNVQVLHT